jgi:hypothetical protein
MLKKLREKFGKKVTVSLVILGLLFLAFYVAGFIEAVSLDIGKTKITQNSSFFIRNSKEIAEGFQKEIEEDGTMKVQKTEFKKGEVHMTVSSTDKTFDYIEYVLTEKGVKVIYTSIIEVDEDQYKQLLVNGDFELN